MGVINSVCDTKLSVMAITVSRREFGACSASNEKQPLGSSCCHTTGTSARQQLLRHNTGIWNSALRNPLAAEANIP